MKSTHRAMILTAFLGSAIASMSFTASSAPATGQAATGCAAKQQSIEKELAIAREKGNKRRVAGLEKAQKEAQECSDQELRSERMDKVRSAAAKVQERQDDLRKDEAKGDASDIAKSQRKLNEAIVDLNDAQAQLAR
jgi:hypothetical protein